MKGGLCLDESMVLLQEVLGVNIEGREAFGCCKKKSLPTVAILH